MEFQGFQNSFPFIIAFCLFIGIFALSWYSYKGFSSISFQYRILLSTLRASALSIILLLIMNPFFFSSSERETLPKIAVFFDNSESTTIQKGVYNGLESYEDVIVDLNFQNRNGLAMDFFSFGTNVNKSEISELSYSEPDTDLNSLVSFITEKQEEYTGSIILSDGIITLGKNPIFDLGDINIPLYTIGLGDSSRIKDISISGISTNTIGYTNTSQIVEINVSQNGFIGNEIEVKISQDDSLLESQRILFDTDSQQKTLQFEIDLTESGLQQFQISTDVLEEESIEENNVSDFNIDVLESRVRIMHLAFSIHPDVKALRSILLSDINNEVNQITFIGNNRKIQNFSNNDIQEYDLFIIHGNPTPSQLQQLDFNLENTPTLFAQLPPLNSMLHDFGLIQINSIQSYPVSLFPNLSSSEHPILELPDVNLDRINTFQSVIRASSSEADAISLFNSSYQGVKTNSPIISILERGNTRRAHIMGWDWYKLVQSNNEQEKELSSTLLRNLINWTSSNPDNRRLKITPSKREFRISEQPMINATLLNESGNPENDAIIEIKLLDSNQQSRTFNMSSKGNGNYSLLLPRSAAGKYSISATAKKGTRTLETRDSEFIVSASGAELVNIIQNEELLRAFATLTGGSYFNFQNASNLWEQINVDNIMTIKTEFIEEYIFPIHAYWWFLLVLILLGTEWVLRKYFALP